MTPQQLRDMAKFYRERPSVNTKKVPRTTEMSSRECADISKALEDAAAEIERLRSLVDEQIQF
jgi:hypothetical protein